MQNPHSKREDNRGQAPVPRRIPFTLQILHPSVQGRPTFSCCVSCA